MKANGIVRCIDPQGRVVLPKELRITFDINLNDSLEIYVDEDLIVLKKYSPECILCSSMEKIISFRGKNICRKCIEELK